MKKKGKGSGDFVRVSSLEKKEKIGELVSDVPSVYAPLLMDLEREEYNIYLNVSQYIPHMKPLDLSSKLETVIKGVDTAATIAQVVSPLALAINPLAGAAVVGAVNLLSPLISKALSPVIKHMDIKDRIVDTINANIGRFNHEFDEEMKWRRDAYTRDFEKIHRDAKRRNVKDSEYTKECERVKNEFLSGVVSSYIDKSKALSSSIIDNLEKNAQLLGASSSVVKIVKVASDYLISTAVESMSQGLHKLLGHNLDVEIGKLHLAKEAQEILIKHGLPYDEVLNKDAAQIVISKIADKCDMHEITVLMLAANESKKERANNAEKPKFYGFEYLSDIGCDKLDEIRKSKCGKGGFELSGGAFEKMLDTPHPKALARMLSSHILKDQVKSGIEFYQTNDTSGLGMLEKMPYSSWQKFETLSKEMEHRDSRTTLGRSLTDFANKIANIFNNLFKRGVKDVALDEAIKNFGQVMYTKESVVSKPTQLEHKAGKSAHHSHHHTLR